LVVLGTGKKAPFMYMRTLQKILVSCFLAAAALAVLAQSTQSPPILGVLRLPEVFGNGTCDRFVPRAVAVFRSAGAARPYARLRVASPWTFPPEGGCEGLRVVVSEDANPGEGVTLPTVEFGYEQSGAIVLGYRSGWYEIAIPGGVGWVHLPGRPDKPGDERFIPVQQLARVFRDPCGDGRQAKATAGRPRLTSDGHPTHWFSTRGC